MHITLLKTDNIPVTPRPWMAPGDGYKANSNLSKKMLSGALAACGENPVVNDDRAG